VRRGLAGLLLLGSILLIACSALHPILPLTAAGDLALIQTTSHWRAIHVGLLYGTGLVIAGIWCRWCVAEDRERAGLTVAFIVLGIGQALNGVNIGYMTGAGTLFAGMAREGADVTAVYQATHLSAVMSGRLGGFLVAIAAGLIGLVTRTRVDEPRWLVGLAWLACVAGLIGNLFAPPGHPLMLTSIGLMAVWQTATALRLLGPDLKSSG
jgi:hypothetical protein